MPEQRSYQGNVYTRNGPGEQWVRQGSGRSAMPSVIQLPTSPRQQRQDARADDANRRADDAARRAEQAAQDAHNAAMRRQTDHDAKFNPDGTPKVVQPVGLGDTTKTGAAYLATLPQNVRARVQQLLDGRSMLTPREKGQPLGQQLMDAANQADPMFDETASQSRYLARQQFTGMGRGSQIVQAADRLAKHANDLYTLSSKLPGPDIGWAFASNLATSIGQSFDQKDVASYNTILPLIAGELQKLTKNGSSTVDESKHIMYNLRPNQPTEARNAAIKEVIRLGEAQMDPLRDAWQSAWKGGQAPPMPMDFSPQTQAVFDNINNDGKPLDLDRGRLPIAAAGGSGAGGAPGGGGAGGGRSIPPPGSGPAAPSPWDTTGQGGPGGLAAAGATEKRVDVPAQMQAEFEAYVAQHRGQLDPADYAAFRNRQNAQYGFGQDTSSTYADEAKRINADVASGQPLNLRIPAGKAELTGLDQFNAGAFNNAGGAFLAGAGSLMGGADEVAGGVRSLINGTSYEVERDKANAMRTALADAHPVANALGTITGTVLDGAAASAAAPGAAAAIAARRGAPTVAGALFGAANGALEDNDNRLGGAVLGTVLGAGGGVVGSKVVAPIAQRVARTSVAEALAKGMNSTANRFRPSPVALALAPKLSTAEAGIARMGPDLSGVRQNMADAADLGLPYSLADADPKLRMLGGTVSRRSPDARTLAEQTFNPRALGQADRAVQAIDTHLAPVTDIAGRSSQIMAAGDQAAGPSYNLARSQPAPVDPQIDAMLATPAGQQALGNARTIALNEGRSPDTLHFVTDEAGNMSLASNPSFETLQYTKRGLDQVLNGYRDQFGNLDLRGNPMAQSVDGLLHRFNARLGELNPDYAAGNATWAGYAQRRDALNMGHDVLPNGTLPARDFDRAVAGLNENTLPEAQRGYATAMADQANKARLASNPYDAIYGSPLQQQKVGALFPKGADRFGRVYRLEGDMAATRNETLGGSQTAPRLAADAALAGNDFATTAVDAATQFATGGGIPLGTLVRQYMGDGLKLGVGKAAESRAADIGRLLFDTTDPRAMVQTIDDLMAKQAAMAQQTEHYRKIAGLLGMQGSLDADPLRR